MHVPVQHLYPVRPTFVDPTKRQLPPVSRQFRELPNQTFHGVEWPPPIDVGGVQRAKRCIAGAAVETAGVVVETMEEQKRTPWPKERLAPEGCSCSIVSSS